MCELRCTMKPGNDDPTTFPRGEGGTTRPQKWRVFVFLVSFPWSIIKSNMLDLDLTFALDLCSNSSVSDQTKWQTGSDELWWICSVFSWYFTYRMTIFSEPGIFLNSNSILRDFPFTPLPLNMCLNCISWCEVSFDIFCLTNEQTFPYFLKKISSNLSLNILINYILIKEKKCVYALCFTRNIFYNMPLPQKYTKYTHHIFIHRYNITSQ